MRPQFGDSPASWMPSAALAKCSSAGRFGVADESSPGPQLSRIGESTLSSKYPCTVSSRRVFVQLAVGRSFAEYGPADVNSIEFARCRLVLGPGLGPSGRQF